jgi:hypothetical protein
MQVLSAEAHEEAITNHLLKRLQQLQSEKTKLIAAVEQEEEYLTNTLSKKLEAVRDSHPIFLNPPLQHHNFQSPFLFHFPSVFLLFICPDSRFCVPLLRRPVLFLR